MLWCRVIGAPMPMCQANVVAEWPEPNLNLIVALIKANVCTLGTNLEMQTPLAPRQR